MADPRTVAVRVAALKALYDRVKDAYNAARAEAADTLQPGDRLRATLADGANIGTVTVVEGRTTAKVTDPGALLKWVQVNAPSEVETVARVRDSYVGALLARCENVDGQAMHAKTGELLPGVRFTTGEPYARVTQTADQLKTFTTALWAGELADVLPASVGPPPRVAIQTWNEPKEGA
jgi:hypothetical protein